MQDVLQTSPATIGSPVSGPWSMEYGGGKAVFREADTPVFAVNARTERQLSVFLRENAYSAATAFIRGEFDVEGDIIRAIRWRASQPRSGIAEWFLSAAAKLARTCFSLKSKAAGNIQFHYDRSNQFYGTFLDSRMVYSCGYFKQSTDSLDEAQSAKLDYICRKLRVERGDRFLDIGCGWGGLLFHAAEHYGATCTGCTLSPSQIAFVQEKLGDRRLGKRISLLESDFQQVRGRFDKIASVGMFEHVGRRRLRSYFDHIAGLLTEDGLFLNHAIARPQTIKDGAETLFLQRKVFPGGDLLYVSDVTRSAEEAGFELLDLENLRPHYALTCRAWVGRLQAAAGECMRLVSRDVYRTWLLYLAACAASFEEGGTDIYQALFAKRSPHHSRPLTREYMYR
jgi:cyclopropane-fatty-acyl-phospholipid synthase